MDRNYKGIIYTIFLLFFMVIVVIGYVVFSYSNKDNNSNLDHRSQVYDTSKEAVKSLNESF